MKYLHFFKISALFFCCLGITQGPLTASKTTSSRIMTIVNYTDVPTKLQHQEKIGSKWKTVKTVAPNSTGTATIKKGKRHYRLLTGKKPSSNSWSGKYIVKTPRDHWTVWGTNGKYSTDITLGTSSNCHQKSLEPVMTIVNYADAPTQLQFNFNGKWITVETIASNTKGTATIENNNNGYRLLTGQTPSSNTWTGTYIVTTPRDHWTVWGTNGKYNADITLGVSTNCPQTTLN